MSLLQDILNCGEFDAYYTNRWYSICEYLDRDFSVDRELMTDCNAIIYECMSFVNQHIFNKVKKHVEDNKKSIEKADEIIIYCNKQLDEPNIFVNCYDSCFYNALDKVGYDQFKQEYLIESIIDYIYDEVYSEAA
jgi:hypothetical protein